MANVKRKQTREEKLEKKRLAERLRYQRLKNDTVKYAEQKEKDRKKYVKKKETGQIKPVRDMTPRERRITRKIWKEKTRKRRARLALQDLSNVRPLTPPSSDNEAPPPRQQVNNNRTSTAKKRSEKQRKLRNKIIKQQQQKIDRLEAKIRCYRKKIQRSTSNKKNMTPNTKITQMLQSPSTSTGEVRKKLLFGEVIAEQLKENLTLLKTDEEKKTFRKVLSGRLTNKYKVLDEIKVKPMRMSIKNKNSLLDMSRKVRKDKTCEKMKQEVIRFLEEDSNSRLCPGKRDFITRNKERKQKRLLLDTMKNLHKKFIDKQGMVISYTIFCTFRPFWVIQPRIDERDTCLCVIHANIDLTLLCLNQNHISTFANHQSLLEYLCCDRYNELCLSRKCPECRTRSIQYGEFDNSILVKHKKWLSVVEEIVDPKTKKLRNVRKNAKKALTSAPKDILLEMEKDLEVFMKHELNIIHQYQTVKALKENLSLGDCIIHMDFSENYNTKYSEEIQAFHFGGSRTQISMHTVVVYTKETTQCFCTMSTNLNHNVPAIWAHLHPVMRLLPNSIENVHFLSDGPVTQYRNKHMFYFLACQLNKTYTNICNYTWNYHEAGHGKGAPDGVGAVVKRTADRLVATGTDIASINDFAKAIEENCPGIKTFLVEDEDILLKKSLLDSKESAIVPFIGTLKVHQVRGNAFIPNKLSMKSLSCFCNNDSCPHHHLGQLTYSHDNRNRLTVTDIYSDSDEETPACSIDTFKDSDREVPGCSIDITLKNSVKEIPGCSENTFKSDDYILVKFPQKRREYRYVGVCSDKEDDDGEISVTFLKKCNNTATLFKVDDNDTAFIPIEQVCEKLPQPSLVVNGDRVFLKFEVPVNIFPR